MSDSQSGSAKQLPNVDLLKKRIRSGAIILAIGIVWALFPIPIAFLSAPGPYAFSEGPGGGGAILWAMILTLPSGAVIVLIGLVRLSRASAGYLRAPVEVDPNNPAVAIEKRLTGRALVSNLLLVPALFITEPIVGFVLNNMIIGGYSGIVVVCLWSLAQLGFTGYSLWCIFKTKRTVYKVLLIATSLIYVLIGISVIPGYLQVFDILQIG